MQPHRAFGLSLSALLVLASLVAPLGGVLAADEAQTDDAAPETPFCRLFTMPLEEMTLEDIRAAYAEPDMLTADNSACVETATREHFAAYFARVSVLYAEALAQLEAEIGNASVNVAVSPTVGGEVQRGVVPEVCDFSIPVLCGPVSIPSLPKLPSVPSISTNPCNYYRVPGYCTSLPSVPNPCTVTGTSGAVAVPVLCGPIPTLPSTNPCNYYSVPGYCTSLPSLPNVCTTTAWLIWAPVICGGPIPSVPNPCTVTGTSGAVAVPVLCGPIPTLPSTNPCNYYSVPGYCTSLPSLPNVCTTTAWLIWAPVICGGPIPSVPNPCTVTGTSGAVAVPVLCGPIPSVPSTNPCDYYRVPAWCTSVPNPCTVAGTSGAVAVPVLCAPAPDPCTTGTSNAVAVPVLCGPIPSTYPCDYATVPGYCGPVPPGPNYCDLVLALVQGGPLVCGGGIPDTTPCQPSTGMVAPQPGDVCNNNPGGVCSETSNAVVPDLPGIPPICRGGEVAPDLCPQSHSSAVTPTIDCDPTEIWPCDETCQAVFLTASNLILAYGMPASNQFSATLMTLTGVAGNSDGSRESASGTATAPNVVPSSASHQLTTTEGGGNWQLSLSPLGAGAPDFGADGRVIAGCSTCDYVGVSVEIPDRGRASQTPSYLGSNPGPSPTTDIDEPPVNNKPAEWAECGLAGGKLVADTVLTGASLAAEPASGGMSTAVLVMGLWSIHDDFQWIAEACGDARTTDPGRWSAHGDYANCWGCDAASKWNGKILEVAGILSFSSELTIDTPTRAPKVPFQNERPEGYYEQKAWYNNKDMEVRTDAWAAHNTFGVQTDSTSAAALTLTLPFVKTTMETVQALVAYQVGATEDMIFYYAPSVSQIIIECFSTCDDQGILQISSSGTGAIVPDGNSVGVTFDGDAGEAEVAILGVGLSGFTLTGQLHAEAAT